MNRKETPDAGASFDPVITQRSRGVALIGGVT
jgi:hypothetical protein